MLLLREPSLILERQKREDDPVEFASADTTFHTTLTESTGNKLFFPTNTMHFVPID